VSSPSLRASGPERQAVQTGLDDSAGSGGNLVRGRVPFLGGLAQSVGLLGPSAGAGILVAAVFGIVGPLGWLSWVIGVLAISCVGFAVVALSRRFLTTGGLFPLAGKAGGRVAGYFTAFGAHFWLLIAAPATVIAGGIFMNAFLSLPAFGLKQSHGLVLLFSTIILLATAWIAHAGIQLSIRILLGIELVTGAAIVLLLLFTLFKHPGGVIDHAQFHFAGTSSSTIISGIVLVTYAFGGFESATVLGQEVHNGRKNIPLAVLGSIVVAGLFLAFTQYVTVLGFSGTKLSLASSPNALGDLANIDGIGWYAYIITGGLVLATFANNIALYNAGARMLFTLPREGAGFSWLRRVSRKHQTPTSGILTFMAFNLVVMIAIGIWNLDPVAAYGDLGSLSGFGAITMYVVTCLATVALLARLAPRNIRGILICLLGAGVMSYGMYALFVPFPKGPARVYTLIFISAAAIAVIGYFVLRLRGSTSFQGRSVDEDTALGREESLAEQ
jgi:amino acid transporter